MNMLKKSKQTQLYLLVKSHKEKEGGTVNSDTQITIQRDLEVFDTTHSDKTLLQN